MCVLKKQHSIEVNTELLQSELDLTLSTSTNAINAQDLSDLIQRRDEAYDVLQQKYHGLNGLAKRLNTNLIVGLNECDQDDLNQRKNLFGTNEIPPKRSKYFIELAFEALQDTTLIILIVCAFVSIGLSFYESPEDTRLSPEETEGKQKEANLEWIEGLAILIAVIVVVFVTAFNDWRKEKQFRGLKSSLDREHQASVIRNGQIKQVNVKDLVVGDVCFIKYGDIIPADGLLIHSNDLKIDESSLTGETNLVKKNDTKNIVLLSGTHTMEGTGKYLVIAVGLNSQTGIILALLDATKKVEKAKKQTSLASSNAISSEDVSKKVKKKTHRSVLQAKLSKLAIQIGYVGILASLITFILLVARLIIQEFLIKHQQWSNIYIHRILSFLIQCVTVIVVAVPEGLPLAVTLSLAYAVRQMTKDNNLVRHLDACETMGSATTICSDKTGTLTTNRMTVVQCFINNTYFKSLALLNENISDKLKECLFESISINTNYTSKLAESRQGGDMKTQIGNKTECALLGFMEYLNGDYARIRDLNPMESFKKVFSFNSTRKMMSTIVKMSRNHEFCLFSKGASEIVLSKCTTIINSEGLLESLTEMRLSHIKKSIENMSNEGLRTICIAFKRIEFENALEEDQFDWENEDLLVSNLTFISLVGIEDPVRDEVPEAIRKCQKSGVIVRMITGDNINTARSIAIKCGILSPSDDSCLILDSKEFNARIRNREGEIDQHLLDQVWPHLRVLARSSPQDKYNLVNGIVESRITSNREVVAVTGDGTNDGPALKIADVGFAMGIQGTDVAKEASDIILTDDNFSSIVKAMMWGRNVYDSIAKFLQFQLTANLTAGLLSIICAASITAIPIKAVQMLWVNLVMDTLASLALGTEPPTEKLLERKPYGRTKPIISKSMIKNIISHAIYQLIIILGLVWFVEDLFWIDSVIKYHDFERLKEPSQHFTMIFNAFVLMTLFNEINSRKIHNERNVFEGILRNPFFYTIWIVCLAGQILIINFGGIAFSVVPLDLDHWLWCLLFGIGSILWGQLVISIPSRLFKRARPEPSEEELSPMLDRKLIWLRSIKRIQQQLRVIGAFKSRMEELKEKSDELGSLTSLSMIDRQQRRSTIHV